MTGDAGRLNHPFKRFDLAGGQLAGMRWVIEPVKYNKLLISKYD
jgi:hypothetical protein